MAMTMCFEENSS